MYQMYKAIKGYEGIYEINELGQVLSVNRIVECKDGYAMVTLHKNGITKTYLVHRLVAEAFLPKPEIHHLNHDRKDNRARNLQWVTRYEHWRAAKGTRLRVVGNGIDKIYNSSYEVERELGINQSNALLVAKGIRKQANGYKIYFADQEIETNNA